MRKLKLMVLFALPIALMTGCAAAVVPVKGGTVNASLTDNMRISTDRSAIPAGPVTFVVKNSGLILHELVVLKTDVAQDKLMASKDEAGKVDETGNVGETGDMNAGADKTITITLGAGHYVLMCNQVGHYESGMHMAFTVN